MKGGVEMDGGSTRRVGSRWRVGLDAGWGLYEGRRLDRWQV